MKMLLWLGAPVVVAGGLWIGSSLSSLPSSEDAYGEICGDFLIVRVADALEATIDAMLAEEGMLEYPRWNLRGKLEAMLAEPELSRAATESAELMLVRVREADEYFDICNQLFREPESPVLLRWKAIRLRKSIERLAQDFSISFRSRVGSTSPSQ